MLGGASAGASNRSTYHAQRTSSEKPAKTTTWDKHASHCKTMCIGGWGFAALLPEPK